MLAILLAGAPLLYGVGALVNGWFNFFMRCDEICDAGSGDWRYTRDAWQWYAIGALAVGAFLAAILFFRAVVQERRAQALVWLAVGAAGIVVTRFGLPVNPGSDQDLDIPLWFDVGSVAVVASGILAVMLTPVLRPDRTRPGTVPGRVRK